MDHVLPQSELDWRHKQHTGSNPHFVLPSPLPPLLDIIIGSYQTLPSFLVGANQKSIALKLDFKEIGPVKDRDVMVDMDNLDSTRLFDNWPPKTNENGELEEHDENNMECYLVVVLKSPLAPSNVKFIDELHVNNTLIVLFVSFEGLQAMVMNIVLEASAFVHRINMFVAAPPSVAISPPQFGNDGTSGISLVGGMPKEVVQLILMELDLVSLGCIGLVSYGSAHTAHKFILTLAKTCKALWHWSADGIHCWGSVEWVLVLVLILVLVLVLVLCGVVH